VRDPFEGRAWSRLASLVLTRSLRLHRGQRVAIDTQGDSLRPAEVLARTATRLGIYSVSLHSPDRFFEGPRGVGSSGFNAMARAELSVIATCNGYVFIPPSHDGRILKRRNALPPGRRRDYNRRWLDWNQSLSTLRLPSVYLLAAAVTPEAAGRFDVELNGWRSESLRGSFVDPAVLVSAGRPLVKRLRTGRVITVRHRNGTHLELGLFGQRPVVDDGVVDAGDIAHGRVWTTVPSGYLTVALDERVAEGRFVSNRPSRNPRGKIRGIDWTFRNGRLSRYEIVQGRKIFEKSFQAAGRERSRPGLFTIGLNPEIREFPLAEDQERGVVTVCIGFNDDYGGRSRGGFRSYAILRGADVFVDDLPLLRRGRWT
jgi:leucyl aminopeptidase (aminopeptidase T)